MAKDDYEVGYGKPPKKNRFQPGQSGNPDGRKKGVKSYQTRVKEMFDEQITLTVNGQQKTMSKGEAITNVLMVKALNGDMGALRLVMKLMEEAAVYEEGQQKAEVDLSAAVKKFDRLMGRKD
jgi:asparagine synthetase A